MGTPYTGKKGGRKTAHTTIEHRRKGERSRGEEDRTARLHTLALDGGKRGSVNFLNGEKKRAAKTFFEKTAGAVR